MSCCENARWKKFAARRSAPRARVMNKTRMAIATSVVGSCRSRHSASDHRPAETRRASATGTRSCWTVASVAISASLHFDPRIDPRVRDVADDVREDQEDARDDDRGLDNGIVLRHRRLEREPPEA